jgi:acyl carrier protein
MLDALAEDRSARGKPAVSIAWGPWAEIGLAAAQSNRGARMAERGLASLSPDEGRRLFGRLLHGGAPRVAAMHFDPARWLETATPSAAALFGMAPATAPASAGARHSAAPPARAGKSGVSPEAMKELVISQLAAVLRTSPDHLAGDRPFRSLGLDSLMGLELRNRLERVLGLKLSASTVWNFPTADQLCGHLAGQVGGSESRAPVPAQAAPKQSAAQALDEELLAATALLAEL